MAAKSDPPPHPSALKELVVSSPKVSREDGLVTVSADLSIDGEFLLQRPFFRFAWSGDFHLPGGESFISLALPSAMLLGIGIRSEAAVDSEFVNRIGTRQEVLRQWFGRHLHRVSLDAPVRSPLKPDDRGCAAFFSGGVDDFHAMHSHSSEIDALFFVEELDFPLSSGGSRALVRRVLLQAASETGHTLIVVEAGAPPVTDCFETWKCSLNAAVANLFAGHFRRFVLGGRHTWDEKTKASDSFLLQRTFALSDLEVVTTGMELDPWQKLAALAAFPPALRHLRVCRQSRETLLNCGRCDRCLRTMIAAHGEGMLERISSLPDHIEPEQLGHLELTNRDQQESLSRLLVANNDFPGREAVQCRLRRASADHFAEKLSRAGMELATVPNWPHLARKLGKPALETAWESDRDWFLKKCEQHLPLLRGEIYKAARAALPWRQWLRRKPRQSQ